MLINQLLKKISLSIAVLLVSFVYVPTAFADKASDLEEINELMWRYARALDTLNADAYVAVFTEDGQFGTGENASKGPEGLRALINGVIAGREQRVANGGPPSPPMFHMTMDSWTEFVDEDHARHHTYWMTVFGPSGEETSPNVAAVGRGVDDLVRVDGQWLIQVRDVAPQD